MPVWSTNLLISVWQQNLDSPIFDHPRCQASGRTKRFHWRWQWRKCGLQTRRRHQTSCINHTKLWQVDKAKDTIDSMWANRAFHLPTTILMLLKGSLKNLGVPSECSTSASTIEKGKEVEPIQGICGISRRFPRDFPGIRSHSHSERTDSWRTVLPKCYAFL